MNALTDDSLGSFKKFITELANITYNRDGKGLLLSQVGDIISKKHPEFRNVLGSRKLVGFIEEELAGVVKILTSPENQRLRGSDECYLCIPLKRSSIDICPHNSSSGKTQNNDRKTGNNKFLL